MFFKELHKLYLEIFNSLFSKLYFLTLTFWVTMEKYYKGTLFSYENNLIRKMFIFPTQQTNIIMFWNFMLDVDIALHPNFFYISSQFINVTFHKSH